MYHLAHLRMQHEYSMLQFAFAIGYATSYLPNMDPIPKVLHLRGKVTGNLRHSREGSSCSTGEFPILRVQVHHLEWQLSRILLLSTVFLLKSKGVSWAHPQ